MSNPEIFKAYDIRGVYPIDLDKQTAYWLGRSVAQYSHARQVVVGCDIRESSPTLTAELIRGLTDEGAQVIDIGLASTPLFNFSVANYPDNDFGVMVSASHNPAQYNGFKLTGSDGLPVGRDSGMEKIKKLVLEMEKQQPTPKTTRGQVIKKEFSSDYLAKIFSLIDADKIPAKGWSAFGEKPLKIVVDTANAMGGLLVEKVFSSLPQAQVTYLYKDFDGRFPNHEANPLKTETLKELRSQVLKQKADLGVAYDGDADRIGFVDETGAVVSGDFLTALLAKSILEKQPGGLILGDVRFSRSVPEYIKEQGGRFDFCQVGHALIKKTLREKNASFAGELSLHFYYRDFFGVESGDLTLLLLLGIISKADVPLSQIIKPLQRYAHSGEINFTVTNKEKIINNIKEKYASQAQTILEIDGLRLDFPDWWMSVRASNTEPLLRLNLEAKTELEMQSHVEEITKIITD